MSEKIYPPEKIWIIVEELSETSTNNTSSDSKGARNGIRDTGGRLGEKPSEKEVVNNQQGEVGISKRKEVEVTKLKQEMRAFLKAMREMLDEAEQPNSKMQLDEVELSVEINGEGEIGLLGMAGVKAGGKGAMTFKFKRNK